jgi:hypothetical protein
VDGDDGADTAGGEYKVSEAVKMVRTCQNLLGQNGTRLGLLLLLAGPNGDGFGGQAFMEHYSGREVSVIAIGDSGMSVCLSLMDLWGSSGKTL